MPTTLGTSQTARYFAVLAASTVLLGCPPNHTTPTGHSCSADGECESGHCVDSVCATCATNADCSAGDVCSTSPRILTNSNALTCYPADAGCASSAAYCPGGGFYCTPCPTGSLCNDSTGVCSEVTVTPPPVCGSSDPSNGYDAGWGPGPNLTNAICDTCIGCPLGSECICGASGLIGGVRCTNLSGALACFATGGLGTCEVFPGDCLTNSQCTSTPETPLCSSGGTCVACLRDKDCSQVGGAQGCVDGKCGPCCTSDSECPSYAPQCISGFCYACQRDGGCGLDAGGAGVDAGESDAGSIDSGLTPDASENG